MLELEELLVAALRAARGLTPQQTAQILNLERHELRHLEEATLRKSVDLTLTYHHELICEPAALSGADRPAARTAAVHEHIDGCRACRQEFAERVWMVLAQAGSIVRPMPPLASPKQSRRGARRLLGRRDETALGPVRAQAA
jgi:hypothetical protein